MAGRILIVDDVAANRIVLKVKLAAASYDVIQADNLVAAEAAVTSQAPSLVMLSDRIGGPEAALRFLQRLRSDPATGNVAVVVLGQAIAQARRLILLGSGADEVLNQPLDEAVLLARVRSLLRQRAENAPPPGLEAVGLAEAASPFETPGLIWVVGPDVASAAALKHKLMGRLGDRLTPVARSSVLDALRTGPMPDLFLIAAQPPTPADFRLLAELRARPGTCAAAVIMMGGEPTGETQIMALDLGAADAIPAETATEELVLRLKLRLRQKRDGDRRRADLEQGLRLALIDPLTGLSNRRAAFARLAALSAEGERIGRGFALMILDIDRFKSINDRHGHIAGDRVLVEVARRLTDNLRETDLVARIGGEEFLVALPDTPLVQARLTAERLRRAVEVDPVPLDQHGNQAAFVTLSIGLCPGPGQNESVEDALHRADQALYSAKARGRNMVTTIQSVA